MPPLARRAVAADVRATIERHARAAAGANNHGKDGLGPGRRAVNGLRHCQTVSVIRQPHFAVQACTQIFIKRLPVKPGGVRVFHHARVRRNRARDPHSHRAGLSGGGFRHPDQSRDRFNGLLVVVTRRWQSMAK
ncbi:hypothetical protein D3C76_1426290 [compost metagenome]